MLFQRSCHLIGVVVRIPTLRAPTFRLPVLGRDARSGHKWPGFGRPATPPTTRYEALTRDKRDIVVMQAITNVTGRREMSPDRTQAIYDEIRRLDQARVNRTSALAERNANNTRNQTA